MRLWVAVLAGIAMTIIVAACDGESAEQLSVVQYFQELERVEREADAGAMATAEAGYVNTDGLVRNFQSDVEELSPPAEAEDLHDELVDALGVYVRVQKDIDDLVQGDESRDISDIGQAFQDSNARIMAACAGLEEVAADHGIEIDLGCATSFPPGEPD